MDQNGNPIIRPHRVLHIDIMWADFQQRHVLDPGQDPNPANWTRAQWNDWFRSRLPAEYGSKQINSVVLSSPEAILQDFANHSNFGHSAGPDFWWSNNQYTIYILNKSYNHSLGSYDYNVIRASQVYFLAKLDAQNRPVHFHRQYFDRPAAGNAQLPFRSYPEVQ